MDESRHSVDETATSNAELWRLCKLAGFDIDGAVFEILLGLVRRNVDPDAIVKVLEQLKTRAISGQLGS